MKNEKSLPFMVRIDRAIAGTVAITLSPFAIIGWIEMASFINERYFFLPLIGRDDLAESWSIFIPMIGIVASIICLVALSSLVNQDTKNSVEAKETFFGSLIGLILPICLSTLLLPTLVFVSAYFLYNRPPHILSDEYLHSHFGQWGAWGMGLLLILGIVATCIGISITALLPSKKFGDYLHLKLYGVKLSEPERKKCS